MARLSLSLLGAMQFLLDGRPVSGFAYNKARALLAYLAVEADRPQHRDSLVGLLWPDLPDGAARTNLRQALANLREVIGDASATPPFLLITRDTIQFNPNSDYDLDVTAFTALLEACESHYHRRLERCRSCAARMEQAIALYKGDFLVEFSVGDSAPFEEWQLRQRERLHQWALDALAQLADYHERRGEDEQARRFASRQIGLDPWREEAHRQLMRLLARGGQRSAALAQYEACRRTLARDLGVEPEAETSALYEQIRDRETGRQGDEEKVQDYSLSLLLPVSPTPRRTFPAQTGLLIGRETELAELGAQLENPACRLITITGPGGVGKTRLALAAATEQAEAFTHGAAFVPLQAISSVAFLAPAILSTLDIPLQGQRDPREQLLDYLRDKEVLLVLDNVEQLLVADQSENDGIAEVLSAILARASGVTLLVTSRERLALPGEWLFDVSGLSYPAGETVNGIEGYGAVRLFVQRAGQVRRQFALADGEAPAVARICRLVEGLPLAIELAAAALRTRSCTAIAAAIESNLSALSTVLRAVPARHRSIRAVFEHSWRLLSNEEGQALARMSVFRGGFEEDAAAQVAQASPQILAALVDKSLLRWDGAQRYDPHELLRQYAGEKLEELEKSTEIKRRHAMYFLGLAETAEPKLLSGKRDRWLDRLEREHDNLRAALAWSQVTADAGEIGLRLVGALLWFWIYRNYMSEGRSWAERAVATASGAEPRAWANALYSGGMLAWMQTDYTCAHVRLMASVQNWRETDDQRGLAFALSIAGLNLCDQQNYNGYDFCAESVTILRELQDSWGLAHGLYFFGNAAFKQGDYAAARSIYEESLALWRTLDDPWGLALPLYRLGTIASIQGDYTLARLLLEESLAIRRQVDHKLLIAHSLGALADVALCQQQYRQAITHLIEALALYQKLGVTGSISRTLIRLARTAAGQKQLERAVRLWGAAQAIDDMHGIRSALGESLDDEQELAAARSQLGEEAFAAAWDAGRAMTLEQAIAYALEGSKVDSASSTATTAPQ